jgi:hypothetical protein
MKKTNKLKRNFLLTISGSTVFYVLVAAVTDPPLDPGLTLITMLAAILLTALAVLYGH